MLTKDIFFLLKEVFEKELYFFDRDGKHIIFGKKSGYLKVLNNQEYNILSLILHGLNIHQVSQNMNYAEERIEDLILEIYNALNKRKIVKLLLERPNSIQLIISESCNMKCSYCYGNYYHDGAPKHNMNQKIAEKSIKFAYELGASSIGFFGGEPLLNFQIVKYIVEYCKKEEIAMQFGITTNGTLVTKAIADYARDNNIAISVSIDGNKEVHNTTRLFPNGMGSFDEVIKSIKTLKEKGCLYMLEMTYSDKHPRDLKQILSNMLTIHNCISCTCVEGNQFSFFNKEIIKGDRLRKYYNDMFDFFIEQKIGNVDFTLGGMNELISSLISETSYSKKYLCSEIMNRITIGVDGNIYPCPETMISDFKIANVNDPDLITGFDNKRIKILEKLRKDNMENYWFSNLLDICYARIRISKNKNEIEDIQAISDSIEDILYKVAVLQEY